MHLQEVKNASGKSWRDLADDAGIAHSMLHDVALGLKWPGAETAPGLLKIGVSLNDQLRFYESQAAARAERAARKSEQPAT